MNLNAHNTTSGDNSSDSASTKNTTKSQLEIVDQKLKKCLNEIELLKKKAQKEWSVQMNNHLKSFYPDDDKSKSEIFSTKSHDSPADTEKKISQLTKKLHSYEKRKQQLLFEQAKENKEEFEQTNDTTAPHTVDTTSKSNSNSNLNIPSSTTPILATNLSNNNFQINTTPNQLTASSSLPLKTLNSANRTYSFTNQSKIMTTDDSLTQLKTQLPGNASNDDNKMFYINQELKTVSYNGLNGDTYVNNDDQLNNAVLNNYKTIHNMLSYQGEQIYFLREQQDKIQAYLEDLQKKMDENQKTVMKELQEGFQQTRGNFERAINSNNYYFKAMEQKIDDLKSSSSQSFQSLQYNFTHHQRDVKDIKEDVSFMKNKVEMVEKNQKNITESNPTNYYQLFYKLLDIFLTIATIILLAFTNLIASIKFIFLLYPRTIVISLFFYFLFFYLVDHNKLLVLFTDSNLLNEFEHSNTDQLLAKSLNDNDFQLNSNFTYFGKLFRSVYKLFFNLKQSSTTTT